VAALLWALPAALALIGAWRVSDRPGRPHRATLRLAGAAALWAAIITVLLVRS
jgi:hypothetical protein